MLTKNFFFFQIAVSDLEPEIAKVAKEEYLYYNKGLWVKSQLESRGNDDIDAHPSSGCHKFTFICNAS